MIMRRITHICIWALLDLRSELRLSVLSVLLLAGLLAPALVMAISRTAVIEGWTQALSADIRNREVRIIGEYDSVTPQTLAALAALPEVDFVIPETSRFLNAIRFETEASRRERVANVRTTRAGDPLLGRFTAPRDDEIVVTQSVAEKFNLAQGDTLTVVLRRQPREAATELMRLPLQVTGVIPTTVWPEELVLLSEARSAGISLWTARPLDARPPLYFAEIEPENPWKSLRIYAKAVALAPTLESKLQAPPFGFDTLLQSDQVVKLVSLETGLDALARALAILSAVGFAVAVLLFQRLAVLRKAEGLALMFVAGVSRKEMVLFIVAQCLVTSVLGVALTIVLVFALQPVIAQLSEALVPGVPPAQLDLRILFFGGGIALVISTVFCLWACREIASLDFPQLLRSD